MFARFTKTVTYLMPITGKSNSTRFALLAKNLFKTSTNREVSETRNVPLMRKPSLFSWLLLVFMIVTMVFVIPYPRGGANDGTHLYPASSFSPILKNPAPSFQKAISLASSFPPVPNAPAEIQAILNQITTSSFLGQVSYLSNIIRGRVYGSTGNERAVKYVADQFREFGLDVSYQYFTLGQPNVIGTLPGGSLLNNECIVIGAHIDTYPSESRGADDNGSGIAAVLELAKALSQYSYNYTIMFVAFNAEELMIQGSNEFLREMIDNDVTIAVMYNFDMILWDSPLSPANLKTYIVHNGGTSAWFASQAANIGQSWVGAPIQDHLEPYWLMSDHKPFWERGIPAVWFFEFDGLSNPYIHSVQDSLSQPEYSPEIGSLATKTAAAAAADFATIVSTQPGFPTIAFSSPPSGTFVEPNNQLPIVLSVDDALSDVTYLEISINDGPWINATAGLTSDSCTYILDASSLYGTVNLQARAYDAEGWIARTSTSLIFDKGIYCEIYSPQDDEVLFEGQEYTIWINVTDPDGRTLRNIQVRINESSWVPATEHVRNQEYYYNWTAMGAGSIPIEIQVVDGNGNVNASLITVNLVNFPPTVSGTWLPNPQPLDSDVVIIFSEFFQDSRGSGIDQVLVYYSIDYSFWRTKLMQPIANDIMDYYLYRASIGPFPSGAQVRFYIQARDNFGHIAIDDNNGIYYSFVVGANLTVPLLISGLVVLVVAVASVVYFIRYRRRSIQTPT